MNPEFQRNLYLEFSFARLVGMPIFLMIIFALSYLLNNQKFDDDIASVAMWIYFFIVILWGGRQAGESIFDEMRNHTWDIQKTSAISPWSLTWGKLFGSTLFQWYGGLFCLFIYAITATKTDAIVAKPTLSVLTVIGYAIVSGLLVQTLSLLVSLFALKRKQLFNSSISYLFVLFLMFFLFGVINVAETNTTSSIQWYSFKTSMQMFGLYSLGFACLWSVIGVYRLLAQELQIRTLPWIWLSFIVFWVLFFHGLIVGNEQQDSGFSNNLSLMLTAFGICTVLTYVQIFIDDNSPMQIRKLWIYSQEEKWQRFLEEMPCWMLTLLLTLPTCLYLSISFPDNPTEELHLYPLAAFLLILRDIGIVLFFSYAPNPKRAFGLSVLYLTFLYWVIPAIFIEAKAEAVAALFLPLFSDHVGFALIVSGCHVAIIGYLVFQRWQNTLNQFQNHA